VDALPQCRERLDARRRKVRVVLPSPDELRRSRADGRQIERPVVELDPAPVDLDRIGQELSGLTRPQQRTRYDYVGPRKDCRQGLDLRPSESCQFEIGSPQIATLPIGLGLAVTDEDQHHGSVDTHSMF
jgi:hypothetical protein